MLTVPVEKKSVLDETLNLVELERLAIERALKRCSGNVSNAAELLGITRYALYRKMEKMEL
jgi:DNA-binding NtrC family response regulator